ncbi:MAG: hypothetical protein L0L50_09215, partial [Propionibacterium sp.]|nr:hypothetical protein [Propionibacterium sp.]
NHLVHMVSGADPCDGTTTHRNWIHTEFPPPEMRQWVQEHRRWIDLCPYLDSALIHRRWFVIGDSGVVVGGLWCGRG